MEFTVAELVKQGYTIEHARQFLDREAVRVRTAKAGKRARDEARAPKVVTARIVDIPNVPASPMSLTEQLKANAAYGQPTLRERMEAVQAVSTPTNRKPGSLRAKADRQKAIRAWAREHGYSGLADFGRIPESVVGDYDKAHESGTATS